MERPFRIAIRTRVAFAEAIGNALPIEYVRGCPPFHVDDLRSSITLPARKDPAPRFAA